MECTNDDAASAACSRSSSVLVHHRTQSFLSVRETHERDRKRYDDGNDESKA